MFIDSAAFALRYEAEGPEGPLHQYVDHYDEAGLVLKTNQGVTNPVNQHEEPESNNATRAKDALKRIKNN